MGCSVQTLFRAERDSRYVIIIVSQDVMQAALVILVSQLNACKQLSQDIAVAMGRTLAVTAPELDMYATNQTKLVDNIPIIGTTKGSDRRRRPFAEVSCEGLRLISVPKNFGA